MSGRKQFLPFGDEFSQTHRLTAVPHQATVTRRSAVEVDNFSLSLPGEFKVALGGESWKFGCRYVLTGPTAFADHAAYSRAATGRPK